jgi:hypothetical protein
MSLYSFPMMSTQETPTGASAEEVLDKIGTACLMALDPCLTREQLAQKVKEIYAMADLRGDGMDLDTDDDAEETLEKIALACLDGLNQSRSMGDFEKCIQNIFAMANPDDSDDFPNDDGN